MKAWHPSPLIVAGFLSLVFCVAASPPAPYHWRASFEIQGVEDDASGITWSPVTQHLYVVIDGPERVVELTTEGKTVRQVKLKGFDDTEGICHIREHLFAVIEENEMTITFVDLSPGVLSVSAEDKRVIRVAPPLPKEDKSGLEGISYDAASDTLFVVKEAEPKAVYIIREACTDNPVITPAPELLRATEKLEDLSDVLFAADEKCLYIVSDRSKALTRMQLDGTIIDHLSLRGGNLGLNKTIKDAEGVTRDDRGNLYICSEPRHINVFTPASPGKP